MTVYTTSHDQLHTNSASAACFTGAVRSGFTNNNSATCFNGAARPDFTSYSSATDFNGAARLSLNNAAPGALYGLFHRSHSSDVMLDVGPER